MRRGWKKKFQFIFSSARNTFSSAEVFFLRGKMWKLLYDCDSMIDAVYLRFTRSSKLRNDLQFPAGWFRKFRICSLLTSLELVLGLKLVASTWKWRSKRYGILHGIQMFAQWVPKVWRWGGNCCTKLIKWGERKHTFLLFSISLNSDHVSWSFVIFHWHEAEETGVEEKLSKLNREQLEELWKIYEKIEKFIPTVDVDGLFVFFRSFIVCAMKVILSSWNRRL